MKAILPEISSRTRASASAIAAPTIAVMWLL